MAIDNETLGAAIALARAIPGTAAADAIAAAEEAKEAAQTAQECGYRIVISGDTVTVLPKEGE